MPSPRSLLVAATVAGLGTVAGASPAAGAVAKRCDDLQGKTKVRTERIKVVEVHVSGRLKGRRAYGCELPSGKVRQIAARGVPQRGRLAGNVNVIGYRLGAHADRFLVVERRQGDGIAAEQATRKSVVDLRTGRSRRFYKGGSGYGCGVEGQSYSRKTPPVDRVVLGDDGAFAVLYADRHDAPQGCFPYDGQALLRGFPASGPPVQLDLAPVDDIPPDSIAVTGSAVTWTNGGAQHRADL